MSTKDGVLVLDAMEWHEEDVFGDDPPFDAHQFERTQTVPNGSRLMPMASDGPTNTERRMAETGRVL